jgi:hypothetical protein
VLLKRQESAHNLRVTVCSVLKLFTWIDWFSLPFSDMYCFSEKYGNVNCNVKKIKHSMLKSTVNKILDMHIAI